jgi:hypothetical protein
MMRMTHIGASRPLIRPSGTFSPLGRRGCRAVSFPPSPLGEKAPEGRMMAPRGTPFPPEGGI